MSRSNTFLISDTHFGHIGVTKFMSHDGLSKMRPWDDYRDMDEALVENWNRVVKPKDKVYHLGDVVINRRAMLTISRLNGKKILIKGNHDNFRMAEYAVYFDDIMATHTLEQAILSHVPIHPSQLDRFNANIHGHLHDVVLNDARYLNVCVEQINYTPIELSEVLGRIQ